MGSNLPKGIGAIMQEEFEDTKQSLAIYLDVNFTFLQTHGVDYL
jgi:hypothetical protein